MALREYVRVMLRYWWNLGISAAAAIVGLLMDMEVISISLPSWVWWTAALGSFVIAQYLSFATLHREVTKYRKTPQPEIYLHTVFDRLYASVEKNDAIKHPTVAVINMIIEKAVAGDIKIFGVRNGPPDCLDGPQEPIEKSYWKHNRVTTRGKLYSGHNQHDRRIAMRTEGLDEIYYSLKVDNAQAELCWPQRKKFRLQWPFRRETVDDAR